jgi:hypothetical protein
MERTKKGKPLMVFGRAGVIQVANHLLGLPLNDKHAINKFAPAAGTVQGQTE